MILTKLLILHYQLSHNPLKNTYEFVTSYHLQQQKSPFTGQSKIVSNIKANKLQPMRITIKSLHALVYFCLKLKY